MEVLAEAPEAVLVTVEAQVMGEVVPAVADRWVLAVEDHMVITHTHIVDFGPVRCSDGGSAPAVVVVDASDQWY